MGSKLILDENKIIDLYNKNFSDIKIAKILNVSKHTILRFRKRNNLPVKDHSKVNKNMIKDLYNKGLNDAIISRILNFSVETVRNCRKNTLNLPSIYKSEQRYSYFDIFSNKEILSVFIGTLFGDASLYKFPQGGNISGMFGHCIKQKEYLEHKRNIMLPICCKIQNKSPKNTLLKDGRTIVGTASLAVNFKSNPQFSIFFNEMYKNSSKKDTITQKVLEFFDEHSLAIFYMDDGYNHKSGAYLCTNNFTIESINIFRDFLYKKWELITGVHNSRVYIFSKSKKKFFSIIEPYIIESMKYKIGL